MALEISYQDKKLRNICENESVARRHLSPAVTRSLRARLDDIYSAEDLFEIPLLPEFISKVPPGSFAIKLAENYQMIFCAVDQNMPLDPHGNVNWHMIRRIKLVEISKYA